MKLLGWMHRKLMQNSIDPIKSPTIGAASSFSLQTISHEQHNYFMEPTRLSRGSNMKFHDSKFEESFEFLSIGTFGHVELLNAEEPPTPTLPMSIEELADQHTDITETDLDLINYELERFLDAEETETPERSSQASIITLSYKPADGADSEGHIHMACPLQNYLLAASVELVETEREVKRERASLGELFKRSNCNIVQDDDDAEVVKKCGGAEEQQLPRKGNVADFMKKVVKKFHSSAPPNPTKKKLSKSIVKMFSKKVYPEEMTEKQFMKLAKGRNKSKSKHEEPPADTKKTKKKTIKLSLAGICKGASPVNAGHWIKTDSDYFVLEL